MFFIFLKIAQRVQSYFRQHYVLNKEYHVNARSSERHLSVKNWTRQMFCVSVGVWAADIGVGLQPAGA